MTAKEMAQILNGCQYGNELTLDDEQQAKKSGLVIVFGYSDDTTEFCGAIDDEVGCFDGGTIYLNKDGITQEDTPNARTIEAVWCSKESDAPWSYRTDIPHETFHVYEGGVLFCIGIVFALADLAGEHSIITNADRIRAMGDEELAEFLNSWADQPWAWKREGGETICWLQQPAEVEA